MKSLVETILNNNIFESRYFKLTKNERNALVDLIGTAIGNLGADLDIRKFEEYINVLSDDERTRLEDLYDVLVDEQSFREINRNIIGNDDIELLDNFLNWVDENDLWGDWEYEGPEIIEKLES